MALLERDPPLASMASYSEVGTSEVAQFCHSSMLDSKQHVSNIFLLSVWSVTLLPFTMGIVGKGKYVRTPVLQRTHCRGPGQRSWGSRSGCRSPQRRPGPGPPECSWGCSALSHWCPPGTATMQAQALCPSFAASTAGDFTAMPGCICAMRSLLSSQQGSR